MNTVNFNKLTPEEERIIVEKGTEPPFSGKYCNFFEKGIYICKRCNAGLFSWKDKFKSSCGWTAFDDELEGAVDKIPDCDGRRTEIVCSRCNSHLGHIFYGEELTEKNTRYCVNSLSMDFIRENQIETTFFAGGCFWGVQYHFQNLKGVLHTVPGYMGGNTENPTYKQVCTGKTGHAETVRVIFNKNQTNFETLVKLFFEIHDPSQINRQGPDIGTQYRSVIFYTNETQKTIAIKLIDNLKQMGIEVVTEVSEANKFFPSEKYHWKYYVKNNQKPYCHKRVKRFD